MSNSSIFKDFYKVPDIKFSGVTKKFEKAQYELTCSETLKVSANYWF